MISDKTKREALNAWIYHIHKKAWEIVDETDNKSNADLKAIKKKAQEIVDFIHDLEEHKLKEI